jgi:hypothetical protein
MDRQEQATRGRKILTGDSGILREGNRVIGWLELARAF